MSARAWHRRNRNKRMRLAIKRGAKFLDANPHKTYPLTEWGLVMMSPQYYEKLLDDLNLVTNINAMLAKFEKSA